MTRSSEVAVRRRVVLVVGLVMTVAVSHVAAQTSDFSGMWTLDRDASQFTSPAFSGGRGGDDIAHLFITQAANGTLIVGTETNGRAASRWDGERLIAEGRQGDMTMYEMMVLSPDRRTLIIEIRTTTPEGETNNRLVYTLGRPVGPCEAWAMPCKEFPQGVQ